MNPTYYITIELLGHLITFGIIAATALVALRRTALLGFRLIFYFAVGQMLLSVLNATMSGIVSQFISRYAVGYALTVTAVLSYLLYAVAIAGVLQLWFGRQPRHA